MGAIYRAVDENLDISVAIKEYAFFSEEVASQFQQEAKTLASLRHPNLPLVFDCFEIEGQAQYLVMDYIEGEDLSLWMSRDVGVTESEALQIGIVICDALIYMHTHVPPITHRDIKPENIKVTPNGEVMLVDFGLAKMMPKKEANPKTARARIHGYYPPEKYGEAPFDHRSDIFSLGATLYAILAGYPPEDSLARTTGKAELSPLRSYQPHISRQTASTIEKALNFRIEDRWPSAEVFKNKLIEAYVALPEQKQANSRLTPFGQPGLDYVKYLTSTAEGIDRRNTARPPILQRLKSLDPVWLIFSAMIILLLLGLVISFSIPPGLQRIFTGIFLDTAAEPQAVDIDPTVTDSRMDISLAGTSEATVSPTPRTHDALPIINTPSPTPTGGGAGMLAYVSERTGLPQIWLLDMSSGETTQFTDISDGACQPDWSPDAKRIVVTSPCPDKRTSYPGSGLVLIDVESGSLMPLPASLEGDFDPAWSPDGEWIAYTTIINGRRQLVKIHLQDLTIIRLSDGAYQDFSPAWSPDGTRLVFVRFRNFNQIWLMDTDGDNAIQFSLSGMIDNSNPAWFPDGNLILFSQALGLGSPSKQLYGMRLEDIGQSKEYPIIPRIRLDYIPLMDNVDVSPDGFWLAFDYWFFDVQSSIYMMSFPGANLTQLTDHLYLDYSPAWSLLP